MVSPLELTRVALDLLDIRVADLNGDKPEDAYRIKITAMDVRRKTDVLEFRVTLGFKLTPKKDSICRFRKVETLLTGVFSLPSDTDESLVNTLVPVNCYAILHGIARGVVAQATGLVAGGPLLLPPINFVEFMEKQERKAQKLAKAQT